MIVRKRREKKKKLEATVYEEAKRGLVSQFYYGQHKRPRQSRHSGAAVQPAEGPVSPLYKVRHKYRADTALRNPQTEPQRYAKLSAPKTLISCPDLDTSQPPTHLSPLSCSSAPPVDSSCIATTNRGDIGTATHRGRTPTFQHCFNSQQMTDLVPHGNGPSCDDIGPFSLIFPMPSAYASLAAT